MRRWIGRHETAAFLALTFGVAWPFWLASGALQRTPVTAPSLAWFVAQLGVFAPALAGLAVGACREPDGPRRTLAPLALVYAPAAALALWISGRGFSSFAAIDAPATWATAALGAWALWWWSAPGRRPASWGGPPAASWTVAAWSLACVAVPTALFLLAWGMAASTPDGAASLPPLPARAPTPFGLLAAFAVNLVFGGALGEEPGWRGAWLPLLLRRRPAFAAAAITSFWWALWHAPVDLAQGFGLTGLGALVARQLWTFPVTVLFTWVTVRAGGSLLPPLLLHATINSFVDLVGAQPARYERAMGVFFVLILVLAVAVLVTDARAWGSRSLAPDEGNDSH